MSHDEDAQVIMLLLLLLLLLLPFPCTVACTVMPCSITPLPPATRQASASSSCSVHAQGVTKIQWVNRMLERL